MTLDTDHEQAQDDLHTLRLISEKIDKCIDNISLTRPPIISHKGAAALGEIIDLNREILVIEKKLSTHIKKLERTINNLLLSPQPTKQTILTIPHTPPH